MTERSSIGTFHWTRSDDAASGKCLRTVREVTALLFLLMLFVVAAQAKDMSDLYSDEELKAWHYILELQTQRNFEILLSQGLDEKEKRAASGVQLKMTLQGRDNDLMESYVPPNSKTVHIPVLPLKFLHDILLANAWLYVNGFDPRTVDHYVSMLKYNKAADFPSGRYPQPLDALGIPLEARVMPPRDPNFENAFMGSMLVASGFIMAHELGHVVLGHPARRAKTIEGLLRQEQDADAFALRALSRIRRDAHNVMMYFALTSAWAPMTTDFPTRQAYEQYVTTKADHPLNGERIRAVGREVHGNPRRFLQGDLTPDNVDRVQRIGTNIMRLGTLVDDEQYQRSLAIRGIGTDLRQLQPRRVDPPASRPGSSR